MARVNLGGNAFLKSLHPACRSNHFRPESRASAIVVPTRVHLQTQGLVRRLGRFVAGMSVEWRSTK